MYSIRTVQHPFYERTNKRRTPTRGRAAARGIMVAVRVYAKGKCTMHCQQKRMLPYYTRAIITLNDDLRDLFAYVRVWFYCNRCSHKWTVSLRVLLQGVHGTPCVQPSKAAHTHTQTLFLKCCCVPEVLVRRRSAFDLSTREATGA